MATQSTHEPPVFYTVAVDDYTVAVDDDRIVRHFISDIRSAEGYINIDLQSQQATLRYIASGLPASLILSDMSHMQAMTEDDLARAIRDLRAELPFILVSGGPEAGIANGVSALLAKSFTREELIALANRHALHLNAATWRSCLRSRGTFQSIITVLLCRNSGGGIATTCLPPSPAPNVHTRCPLGCG